MLIAARTTAFHHINDVRNATVAQTEFLLVKSTVFNAASQIVHAFTLQDVRKYVFSIWIGSTATNPEKISNGQAAHFEANVVAFQFLNGNVQTALCLAGVEYNFEIVK